MRKKKSSDEGGGPNWLDTYADMVTLLLTFFVLLFSISSVNAEKWEILVKSFAGDSGEQKQIVVNADPKDADQSGLVSSDDRNGLLSGENQADSIVPEKPEDITDFDQLYYYLKKYVEDNNLKSDIELQKGDNFTFVTFRNNIFFSGDSAVLRSEGKKVLDVFSRALKPIHDQIGAVRFEGHTARSGSKDDPNNVEVDWQLSAQRAVNVLTYIYGKNVIEPKKLTATGHGEHDPIVPHDGTEATRIRNRRVEIYIAREGTAELSLSEIYKQIEENEKAGKSGGQTSAAAAKATTAAKADAAKATTAANASAATAAANVTSAAKAQSDAKATTAKNN